MKKFAFVFPGQGSQYVGMLNSFKKINLVKNNIFIANKILKKNIDLIISRKNNNYIDSTINTQPALLISEISIYNFWISYCGLVPKLISGHSLGEYVCLIVSRIIDLYDVLKIVKVRAFKTQNEFSFRLGGMAVILGLNKHDIKNICYKEKNINILEISNSNSLKQVVISGYLKSINHVCKISKYKGAKTTLTMRISGPFHSSLMLPVMNILYNNLQKYKLKIPKIKIINNVDVSIYNDLGEIIDSLIRQIWYPVRWAEITKFMKFKGITHIIECGPKKIISNLIRRIDPKLNVLSIDNHKSINLTLNKLLDN